MNALYATPMRPTPVELRFLRIAYRESALEVTATGCRRVGGFPVRRRLPRIPHRWPPQVPPSRADRLRGSLGARRQDVPPETEGVYSIGLGALIDSELWRMGEGTSCACAAVTDHPFLGCAQSVRISLAGRRARDHANAGRAHPRRTPPSKGKRLVRGVDDSAGDRRSNPSALIGMVGFQ